MILALTTLALLAPQPETPAASLLPLEVGRRWTYEQDGETATILEVVDSGVQAMQPTRTLRVRGASLFWHTEDLVLTHDPEEGIRQLAYVFQGERFTEELPLLPHDLSVGRRWQCSTFEAEVVRSEKLTVPAGTFDTSLIEYRLKDLLGTENDLRIWITPGTGIVQYQHWQESVRGRKKAMTPRTFRLTESVDLRTHRLAPAPVLTAAERVEVDRMIAALGSSTETADPFEEIVRELRRIGRAALRPLLDAADDEELTPTHRERLRRAIAAIPKLRLTASADPVQSLGEPLKLNFRLHNDWLEPLAILPSLDGSDFGRKPRYHLEIVGPNGKPVTVIVGRCGNTNPLRKADFRTLVPGESLDPLGPGTFSHYLLHHFRPEVAGRYRARLTLDTTEMVPTPQELARQPGGWGPPPIDPKLVPLLEALPAGRFVSNEITFEVRAR